MSRIKIYRLGRNSSNDYVINDDTVSRSHAEYIVCDDGRLYVTDCHSTSGTFVFRGESWQKIRQDFVAPDEKLRFGEAEVSPVELASRAKASGPTAATVAPQAGESEKLSEAPEAGTGFVRNPETGEIISKQ